MRGDSSFTTNYKRNLKVSLTINHYLNCRQSHRSPLPATLFERKRGVAALKTDSQDNHGNVECQPTSGHSGCLPRVHGWSHKTFLASSLLLLRQLSRLLLISLSCVSFTISACFAHFSPVQEGARGSSPQCSL